MFLVFVNCVPWLYPFRFYNKGFPIGILTVAEVEQLKNNKDGICDVVNLFSFFLAFLQSFAVFVG
jgi:hypothetical protein